MDNKNDTPNITSIIQPHHSTINENKYIRDKKINYKEEKSETSIYQNKYW